MKAKIKRKTKPIICDNCKVAIGWWNDLVKIIKEEKIEIENDYVYLTFFSCPVCKKIYRVSVLTEDLKQMQISIRDLKKELERNDISESRRLMLERIITLGLIKHKEEFESVQNKYKGTFTYAASENNSEDKIIYKP